MIRRDLQREMFRVQRPAADALAGTPASCEKCGTETAHIELVAAMQCSVCGRLRGKR